MPGRPGQEYTALYWKNLAASNPGIGERVGVEMPQERDEIEEKIDEFLEGRPRSSYLAELRAALARRLEGTRAALKQTEDPKEQEKLRKEIAEMERQDEVLAREELITEFVEDSVRATVSWSLLKPEDDEGEA
ncbi:MAG TPA: hypothetical protein PLJ31_02490 [Armatimonadota bacterium]|nr:hypothetical protein [Armatimonadota bacterium]